MAVGNGRRTLFWDHSWADKGCLSDKIILPVPDTIIGATVSEMWDENSGWKWDEFANYLPQDELQKISSFSLSTDPYMEDELYWNASSCGKFSIKSALSIIKGADSPEVNNPTAWHLIWKLPVQQRIRMFIWLAAHDRLMTNYNRVRRGLADDTLCPRCLSEDETTDHLLRLCPVSAEIWSQIGDYANSSEFFDESFNSWLTKNASNGSALASNNWSMKFAITCWWLWKWRNNIVYGKASENPIDPMGFLLRQFENSKQAFDPFSLFIPSPGTSRVERFIRWHCPPHSWTLLNTDGASRGNPGPAGCGGIFRDDTGNFIAAFLFGSGICSSLRAEMRALLVGLEQARAMHITRLLVHMDNRICVDLLNTEQLTSNSIRPLIRRCKELKDLTDWEVRVEHVYREANRAADWLATKGILSSTTVSTIDSPPMELRSILREDILGVSFPRLAIS